MTTHIAHPFSVQCREERFRASTCMRVASALVTVLALAGCSQAPKLADATSAQTTKPPSTVVAPGGPEAPKVEPKAAEAPPAVPPVNGEATSVTAAKGSVAPVRSQPSAHEIATASSVTPAGATRYHCVRGAQGAESRAPIAFPENSGRICARFPAMGPCQYERDACRAGGGRVIRFDGIEITKEVENEYDKQVTRFRLNAG